MAKENDLLFNQLQNPMFTSYDFKQVGLDINNTSLEDKEVYKNLDFVKNNQLLQTDGAFDEAKFDVLYKTALSNYNEMAQNKVGEDIGALGFIILAFLGLVFGGTFFKNIFSRATPLS